MQTSIPSRVTSRSSAPALLVASTSVRSPWRRASAQTSADRIDQAGGGLVVRHRQGSRGSRMTPVSQRRLDSCEVERLPESEIDGGARHTMDLQDFRDARPESAVHRNDHRRVRREQRHARRLDGRRRRAGDEDDAVPFVRAQDQATVAAQACDELGEARVPVADLTLCERRLDARREHDGTRAEQHFRLRSRHGAGTSLRLPRKHERVAHRPPGS